MIEELKTLCNFETEQGPQEDYIGYHDQKNDKWTGLLEVISNEAADIGGSLFTRSNDRMKIVDYVHTLTRSRVRLYAKLPDNPEVRWDAYFRVSLFIFQLGDHLITISSSFFFFRQV